jgi:uncharacterized protein YkwD
VRREGFIVRALFCAVLCVAASGCADMPYYDTVSGLWTKKPPDPKTEMPALETRIYALIQEKRHEIDPKAKSLSLDPELVTIARKRSQGMAATGTFTGGSGDPHQSATMLMDEDAKFQGLVGENVAAQRFSAKTGIDVDAYAKRFVDSWLASAPHKENLSFPDYTLTGVGAAANGDTVYVTQLFSSDLGLGPRQDGAPTPQATPVASPAKAKDDQDKVPLRGQILPDGAN